MFLKKIKYLLTILLLYQTLVISKSYSFERFNSKSLSKYFSGIVALENKDNSSALEFFNSSKILLDIHEPYLKRYVNSLVLENKISQAINVIKSHKNKDDQNFFDAYLLLIIDSLKKDDLNTALAYFDEIKKFDKRDKFNSAIWESLKQYIYLFKEKKFLNQKQNFGKLSIISEAFQRCYLDDKNTDAYFLKLINDPEGDYTRYLFFYLTHLIMSNRLEDAKKITDNIEYINTTLLISQSKSWLEEGSSEELKFGDNDRLSAIVSIIVNAVKLIIITNKEGLYNFNPDKNKEAKKIDYIEYDSNQLNDLIPLSKKGEGMGGFSTKIMASQISGFSGIPTQIISWSKSNLLKAILNEKVGTFITASNKKIRLRKLWIAYGMASVANVFIDEGAANALQKNASLLSKGVIKFNNSFKIGDGLSIVFNKKVIAKGIAKIDSNTFEESSLVIHKDDLIIL